jgi:heme/copper-type cytochrome/quinol oxidase subunit 2
MINFKNFRLFFLGLAVLGLFFSLSLSGRAVSCDVGEDIGGVCVPDSSDVGLSDETLEGEDGILMTVANWMMGVVGILTIVMIAVAGVMYITSGGDDKHTEQAKNMLKWAITGLIVTIIAFVIIKSIDLLMQGGPADW